MDDMPSRNADTLTNLNVSRIMVNRTNFPRRGTTREVGGMISARRRKNTVKESRMEMDKDTWQKNDEILKKMLFKEIIRITFSPLSEGR